MGKTKSLSSIRRHATVRRQAKASLTEKNSKISKSKRKSLTWMRAKASARREYMSKTDACDNNDDNDVYSGPTYWVDDDASEEVECNRDDHNIEAISDSNDVGEGVRLRPRPMKSKPSDGSSESDNDSSSEYGDNSDDDEEEENGDSDSEEEEDSDRDSEDEEDSDLDSEDEKAAKKKKRTKKIIGKEWRRSSDLLQMEKEEKKLLIPALQDCRYCCFNVHY